MFPVARSAKKQRNLGPSVTPRGPTEGAAKTEGEARSAAPEGPAAGSVLTLADCNTPSSPIFLSIPSLSSPKKSQKKFSRQKKIISAPSSVGGASLFARGNADWSKTDLQIFSMLAHTRVATKSNVYGLPPRRSDRLFARNAASKNARDDT